MQTSNIVQTDQVTFSNMCIYVHTIASNGGKSYGFVREQHMYVEDVEE